MKHILGRATNSSTLLAGGILAVLIALLPLGVGAQFFNLGAFWKRSPGLGAFSISGIIGASDSVEDAWLTGGLSPSVVFSLSTGATAYDVVIRDSGDTTTFCSALNVTASPASPASCTLTNGTGYLVQITAKAGSTTLAATNTGFAFTVDTTFPTTNTITGVTGGTDSTADAWLVGGLLPTVNWNAFTNASSYDVTVKDAAGVSTVCATANTTSTSHAFSSCTLVDGTSYKAYVTAKSPSGINQTDASNTAYSFTVDNTTPAAFSVTGVTGGTDGVIDATLSNGTDPTVNYQDSTGAVRYDVVIKDSTGATTVCSALNVSASPTAVTGCSLSDGGTYKIYVTAESASGALTRSATNDGYDFTVSSGGGTPAPGDFTITGATGGTDATADSWLVDSTNVTANWGAATGATSYDVRIRNEADSADVCPVQNTTSTSLAFSSCTLTVDTVYLINVVAKNGGATLSAANNGFAFLVINASPGAFSVTGVSASPSDTTADAYLMGSTTATVTWSAAANATSYDVTIRNSADTADVCATQNSTTTSHTFTGCALTADTTYLLQVVAKKGTASRFADNSPKSFLVAGTVYFCPTGVSNLKALLLYDSGGPTGNYGNSESCNFTISPPATASSIVLSFQSFATNANSDVMSVYSGTNTSGTLLGTFANTTTPPADQTSTTGNMHITWSTGNSGNVAGYAMSYVTSYALPGVFSITGVTGGTDVTADAFLTASASPTVSWGASSGAVNYTVAIRDSSNSSDICTRTTTASTSVAVAGCRLVEGGTYVVLVYALNTNGEARSASNNNYTFKYTLKPTAFSVSGVAMATDFTPTVKWSDSLGEDNYDVAIYENDSLTVKCAAVNVAANTINQAFSSCILTDATTYRVRLSARNINGTTLASNNYYSFVAKLSGWTAISTTGAPAARDSHTAVWTGSEMIVWGGKDGTIIYSTGGIYTPATDSWRATQTTNAPAARYRHYSSWGASVMVIWGGILAGGSLTNTGGRYDPVNDSWAETTTTGAPTARQNAWGVWADPDFIVWGGDNNALGVYASGGRYNPATDTWTATTTTGAPAGRYNFTAEWTGVEMIVWGGNGSSGVSINTGGRYNPTTDVWVATTTTGAPTARQGHVAVWTGTEMLIWGGKNDSTGVLAGAGARYSPTSNSWAAISTTSQPALRVGADSAWSGSELIIWGRGGSGSAVGGAKYDPTLDAWTATADDPAIQSMASSVWTGATMIIWGGYSPSVGDVVNTGYSYQP